jgi:prepilin-type N-terminal cleavage/methylation domain-containing protein
MMHLKFNRLYKTGFSLLELTIVLIIITILATAVIPQLINGYLSKAANKTALDISAIQEAGRAYYVANNHWPSSIADLQAGNYLPALWNSINPFGFASANPSMYSYNLSSTSSLLTVNTSVPLPAQPIIQNLLPVTFVTNNNIFSSVPVPGASSVLPTGMIMPWASSNLPAGFLWCNGQSVSIATYPGLFAVIGTNFGGDGLNTFGLPDIMGRTIVGVDGMGGAIPANRIILWGNSPAIVGGIFGESSHILTMAELPASSFNVQAFMANGSHQYGIQGSNNGGDFQTANSGMNLGSGIAHNVVQPSLAMGFIIKY